MEQPPNEEPGNDSGEIQPPDLLEAKPSPVADLPPTAKSTLGLKLTLATITAAALGVVGTIYGPTMLKKVIPSGEVNIPGEVGALDATVIPKTGFVFTELPAVEAIRSLTITLKTGALGDDLAERVDLHLGLGFPLRLFPLGDPSLAPSFAAFPKESSLTAGSNRLVAGESATFEFSADETTSGLDILKTTPELFRDLTIGDISAIGFSSVGESGWILEAYEIKINGKTFAEHDSVNGLPSATLSAARQDLELKKPESIVLLKEIADLENYLKTGLAGEKDKADLAAKEQALTALSTPLNALAGVSSGYYPWYVESDEAFVQAMMKSNPVSEIGVLITAGGGEKPGTQNPLYLKAGARKFQLTSETDPLSDLAASQEFVLSLADLRHSPVTKSDLEKAGLGIVGNEAPFGAIPDRANISRIVITADGETIFDSEKNAEDRRVLQTLSLVPPVHFDTDGKAVKNEESATEKHLWTSGMKAPLAIPDIPKVIEPDAPIQPGLFEPLPLPEIPTLTSTPKIPPAVTPGGIVPTVGKAGPKAITPTIAPLAGGTKSPPKIKAPPQITGGGTQPPRVGRPPSVRPGGITSGPAGRPTPNRPGSSGPATPPSFTGFSPGTFVPGGTVDPVTGLIRGTLQPVRTGGFTPIRTKNPFGGLTPAVFNPPTTTANPPRKLTLSGIGKIMKALFGGANATPAKPTPTAPTPPPTLGTVTFPNTMSALQIGSKVTVDWTLLGKTTAASGIGAFKVDLLPVVPHLSPPLPAGAKPLVTAIALSGARSVTLPSIELPAAGTFPGIKKEDLPLLYVQPRVTALDTKGKTVGTAKDGPILPLFPDPASYGGQNVRFSLLRGITVPPTDDAASRVGGSFQIIPTGGKARDSWQTLGLVKPGPGQTNVATIAGIVEEGTLAGIRFAPTEVGKNPLSFNTAVRTQGGNQVVMVFESGVTIPNTGYQQKVTIGAPGSIRGFRVVGHLGFLSGSKSGAGRADVQMSVELDLGKFRPGLNRKKNGDPEMDSKKAEQAFFKLATTSPIEVNKIPGGAMQAFDIPISFVSLAAYGKNTYPPSSPLAHFTAVPFGADKDPKKHLTAPMTFSDFNRFGFADSNTMPLGVTITVTADTSKADPGDTLGIFGLRLVPDIY